MVAYVKSAIKMREYSRKGINGQLPGLSRVGLYFESFDFRSKRTRAYLFLVITGDSVKRIEFVPIRNAEGNDFLHDRDIPSYSLTNKKQTVWL